MKNTDQGSGKPLPNARHERFAHSLASGLSADAAYAEAGYKPHRSNPARLSGNERIRARVAQILAAGAELAEITVARLVEELGKIAFANIGDIFESWGPDGIVLRKSSDLTSEVKAAVAEISETHSRGEKTVRIKMHPKLAAIEQIGKHLGMFVERREISGPNGGQIPMVPITHYQGIELSAADAETRAFLREKRLREFSDVRKVGS